jgi:hypothetical protein
MRDRRGDTGFVRIPEGKGLLGRTGHTLENNIKMNLKEVE